MILNLQILEMLRFNKYCNREGGGNKSINLHVALQGGAVGIVREGESAKCPEIG